MINIDKAFNTENRSIYEYFVQPGVGLYIPLYQREYSWDTDNVEQLLEDISKGIEDLSENSHDNQIRFLGTIITVTESDKNNIQPQDTKALPPAIEKVIDGQQRISTIALLSALLYQQITELEKKLEKSIDKFDTPYDKNEIIGQIHESTQDWKKKLQSIFGVDLNRGMPSIKPKIIRGNQDKWIMKEEKNTSYCSQVANYLYLFIELFFNDGIDVPFPKDKETNAGRNLRRLRDWLVKEVTLAHLETSNTDFCDALTIINKIAEENIWQYERKELRLLLKDIKNDDKNTFPSYLSSLVQVFAVCHYLLDRCCFTIIKPSNDDWAFDMFQSLNATGTPLTAIETFKPMVVQSTIDFKGSIEDKYFQKIDIAFNSLSTAAKKNKLTSDLLTSFALPIGGRKLATHFSAQRKWLVEIFNEVKVANRHTEFIKFFGDYTEFYSEIWNDYSGQNGNILTILEEHEEAELASLLLLLLKDSNHKMSITLLGLYYHLVSEDKITLQDFVDLIKVISAFYLIWRACQSNSGLDEIYRVYFRGSTKLNLDSHTWLERSGSNISNIKKYFKENLPYINKSEWLEKARKNCTYSKSLSVCRFALFNAAHDTIPDEASPGLFKKSAKGKSTYFTVKKWISPELNSIEHIAPQKNKGEWDKELYDNYEYFNNIGNLTLLPKGVNTSVSNKGWAEKLIYYKHLGESDPDKLKVLIQQAKNNNIELTENNILTLSKAEYADHIRPLLQLSEMDLWDVKLVEKRADNILGALWDRVIGWID